MDEKVSLPEGGWALLRDPRRVTERQRRPVTRLQARVMGSDVGALLAEKEMHEKGGEPPEMVDAWFNDAARKILGGDDWTLLDDLNDALIGALVAEWSYPGEPSAEAALDLPGEVYEALKAECAKRLKQMFVAVDPGDVTDETSPIEPSVD